MKSQLTALALVLAFTGCTSVSVSQRENKDGTERTTDVKFFRFLSPLKLDSLQTTNSPRKQGFDIQGLKMGGTPTP